MSRKKKSRPIKQEKKRIKTKKQITITPRPRKSKEKKKRRSKYPKEKKMKKKRFNVCPKKKKEKRKARANIAPQKKGRSVPRKQKIKKLKKEKKREPLLPRKATGAFLFIKQITHTFFPNFLHILEGLERKYLDSITFFFSPPPNQTLFKKFSLFIFFPKFFIHLISHLNKHTLKFPQFINLFFFILQFVDDTQQNNQLEKTNV